MKYKIFIAPFLLLISFAIDASELKSDQFSFQLAGEWDLTTKDDGAKSAIYKGSDKKRAFMLSVYHPATQEETVKFLVDIQDYITNLNKVNSDLTVEKKYTEYKSKSGAPFMYITYSDKKHKGFFIGCSLGSSAGILLITFEGSGDYKEATKEFVTILDSMNIEGE